MTTQEQADGAKGHADIDVGVCAVLLALLPLCRLGRSMRDPDRRHAS